MLAYVAAESWQVDTNFLIAFGAGNFVYIGASDLIPQVNKGKIMEEHLTNFFSFCLGLGVLFLLGHH